MSSSSISVITFIIIIIWIFIWVFIWVRTWMRTWVRIWIFVWILIVIDFIYVSKQLLSCDNFIIWVNINQLKNLSSKVWLITWSRDGTSSPNFFKLGEVRSISTNPRIYSSLNSSLVQIISPLFNGISKIIKRISARGTWEQVFDCHCLSKENGRSQ